MDRCSADPVCPPTLAGKRDHAIFERDDALIGYGHPMGVPAEILKDVFRMLDRFLDIDDPRLGIGLVL